MSQVPLQALLRPRTADLLLKVPTGVHVVVAQRALSTELSPVLQIKSKEKQLREGVPVQEHDEAASEREVNEGK